MPTKHKPSSAGKNKADKRVRDAALALIRKDRDLDDSKYTPPGAIGHYGNGKRAQSGNRAE